MLPIKQITKSLGGFVGKNSPTILTGIAVTGLVTTVILAVRATPKAMALIRQQHEEMEACEDDSPLTKRDIIKLTWRCYIPAAGVGLATAACMVGANSINTRRNAALATVYGITEAAFKEYKSKIVEEFGETREQAVRDSISADRIRENPPPSSEVIIAGTGDVICYDSLSGRYFKSDMETIRRAINELNRQFLTEMWMSVNDLYYALGMHAIDLGEDLGWDIDKGLIEITFSTCLSEKGEPCLALNYDVQPRLR